MSFDGIDGNVSNNYLQNVSGTYGRFKTAAGEVCFLESKARLSNSTEISSESRLTQFLRPVREALPVAEMNFNQLLQRDLDDHRVAVELVPYLLTPKREGPAFFPPIVACLLPFNNRVPSDSFPTAAAPQEIKDFATWRAVEYGAAFRADVLVGKDGKDHPLRIGRVNWNPEAAELVIIDGQHRAMALLAVDRTINHRWTGSAEKYKAFYEPVVKRCLANMSAEQRAAVFESLELPVTIIWFAGLNEGQSQHKAARKVFVDLNKNARPPSPSRLMLLSDNDLVSIFTREVLNRMRTEGAGYPIFGVEYDNPARDQASSAKWSTLINITAVYECVRRLMCGPEKFFTDMSTMFVGRDNETQMRLLLQESLDVKNALPQVIEDDRSYERDEIDQQNFPSKRVAILVDQFEKGWGSLISHFYARLKPFQIHAEALRQLREGWMPNGDPASSLAKEAIFEGVGLYWTVRDGEAHWREENNRRSEEKQPALPRTDVVNAWDVTETKKNEFYRIRAKLIYGSESKISESNGVFLTFSTAACQLGFVLAARTLAKRLNVSFDNVERFSSALISALNCAIEKRLAFMVRNEQGSINLLPKLDTPFAVHFRYFWLELICSLEAAQILADAGFTVSCEDLLSAARRAYRDFVIKQFAKKYKDSNPDLTDAQAVSAASADVDKRIKKSLLKHFEMTAAQYKDWVEGRTGAGDDGHEHGVDVSGPLSEETGDVPDQDASGDIEELERLLHASATVQDESGPSDPSGT